jgi:hypothetical protein
MQSFMLLQPSTKSLSSHNEINTIFFKLIELCQTYTNYHASRGTHQSFANQFKHERNETVGSQHNRYAKSYRSTQPHDF